MNKYPETNFTEDPEPIRAKDLGLREEMDRYESYIEDLDKAYGDLRQITSEVYGSLPLPPEKETPAKPVSCFLEAFTDANDRLRKTIRKIEDLTSYIRAKG
jgi:hypothetical protein